MSVADASAPVAVAVGAASSSAAALFPVDDFNRREATSRSRWFSAISAALACFAHAVLTDDDDEEDEEDEEDDVGADFGRTGLLMLDDGAVAFFAAGMVTAVAGEGPLGFAV